MKAIAKLLNAKNAKHSSEEQLKMAVDEIIKDKETVQTIFERARADYRKSKEEFKQG